MAWMTEPMSAVPPATVARRRPAETGRVRRSAGRWSPRMEAIGKNLTMPPSDPQSSGTDRDVLTSLPRTRPSRRSAKRDRPVRAGTTPPDDASAAAATDTPGRARRKAAANPKPAAAEPAPAAGAAAPRRRTTAPRTATRRRPAGERARAAGAAARRRRTPAPRTATGTRAKTAATPRAAGARSRSAASARTTAAAGAPGAGRAPETTVPPAGYATPAPPSRRRGPDPFGLATTTVQAAGEIAQIGATLWGQAMRSAINRLPRP